jgi:hypothetical protein
MSSGRMCAAVCWQSVELQLDPHSHAKSLRLTAGLECVTRLYFLPAALSPEVAAALASNIATAATTSTATAATAAASQVAPECKEIPRVPQQRHVPAAAAAAAAGKGQQGRGGFKCGRGLYMKVNLTYSESVATLS